MAFFFWRGRVWRPFPGSSPSAPQPVSQLPIPAETSFRNAFLDAALPPRLCPPPFQHSLGKCLSIAIHLRRSFLRYRPSASRSGRGVADESLMRLRTAAHTHEPCQQVVTPRVAVAHPKIGSQRSASKGQSGSLRASCFDKVLLAGTRPRSFGAEPGRRRKGARFLPRDHPHRTANAGPVSMPVHLSVPTERKSRRAFISETVRARAADKDRLRSNSHHASGQQFLCQWMTIVKTLFIPNGSMRKAISRPTAHMNSLRLLPFPSVVSPV